MAAILVPAIIAGIMFKNRSKPEPETNTTMRLPQRECASIQKLEAGKCVSVSKEECAQKKAFWDGNTCVDSAEPCASDKVYIAHRNVCEARKNCNPLQTFVAPNSCRPKSKAECSGAGVVWRDGCEVKAICTNTFYDAKSNKCVPRTACSATQVYDPKTNSCSEKTQSQCVGSNLIWAESKCQERVKCNSNEFFDASHDKCLPRASCTVTQVYDPNVNTCSDRTLSECTDPHLIWAQNKCQKRASCHSGQFFDVSQNKCVPKAACSATQVYDAKTNSCSAKTQSQCVGPNLIWAENKCQERVKCKSNEFFDASQDKCVAKAACTAVQEYNPQTNTCSEKSQPQCFGGNLIWASGKCQEKVSCHSGQFFDASQNKCVAKAACAAVQEYNPQTNTCSEKTQSQCSGGNLIWAENKCQERVKCNSSEFFDAAQDKCVAKAACTAVQEYNPQTNTCSEKTQSQCSGGNLIWASGKCQERAKCESGQFFDAAQNRCVPVPTCTATQMYNAKTNACDARTQGECTDPSLAWAEGKCQNRASCGYSCVYNAKTNTCEKPAGFWGNPTQKCYQVCPSGDQRRGPNGSLCANCGTYGCDARFHCHPDGICRSDPVAQADCKKAPEYHIGDGRTKKGAAAPNFVWAGGKCEPQAECKPSEFLDAAQNKCVPRASCTAVQAYNQKTNVCDSRTEAQCKGAGIVWHGGACAPVPTCATTEVYNAITNDCEVQRTCAPDMEYVPSSNACVGKSQAQCTGDGLAWFGGKCVQTPCKAPRLGWNGKACLCPEGRCGKDCGATCAACKKDYYLDKESNTCLMKCPVANQQRKGEDCACGAAGACPASYPFCNSEGACSDKMDKMYLATGEYYRGKGGCQNMFVTGNDLQAWGLDGQFGSLHIVPQNAVSIQFRRFVEANSPELDKFYRATVVTKNWSGILTFKHWIPRYQEHSYKMQLVSLGGQRTQWVEWSGHGESPRVTSCK